MSLQLPNSYKSNGGGTVMVYILLSIFTGLVITIVIIMALREVFCWYWKTNEILERMDSIQKMIEEQGKRMEELFKLSENNKN